MTDRDPLRSLSRIVEDLRELNVPFALVGGLAVSVRGEVRTTRDVDLAVAIEQADLERLIVELRERGYVIHRLVEHETAERTATVRLLDRSGVLIDLLAASSGIEAEIVATSTQVRLDPMETIPIAGAEELLATKILAESAARPQDRLDGLALLRVNPELDLARVRQLASAHCRTRLHSR